MPGPRALSVSTAALLHLGLFCTACPSEPTTRPAPTRFEAAAARPAVDSKRLCEKTWPASGAGVQVWSGPPLRRLDGVAAPRARARTWRWVNAWATWCAPCVEEMALLSRWRDGLKREGVEVSFEMLSLDAPEDEEALRRFVPKLPGPLAWVESSSDFPDWLQRATGLDPDSAIPIHFLVDPSGHLRCARVGAVHAQDYGAVRAFLSAATSE